MAKEGYPNRIWVILASKQITSHWLVTQLEFTDITVLRWHTNKNQSSISQLIEIAKLLNLDIKELINDYDTNTFR